MLTADGDEARQLDDLLWTFRDRSFVPHEIVMPGRTSTVRVLICTPESAADDSTVEQRIRSEAFRELDVDSRDIDVEVSDGVARLSGEVRDEEVAAEVVERVEKVDGVEEVVATLRAPGGTAG